MTEYALLHIDEFGLKVKSKNKCSEQYYMECVLLRDVNSDMSSRSHLDVNKDIMEKAGAILGREVHTQNTINAMPPKFERH